MDTCNSCVQHAPDLGVREDIKWAADDVHSMCLALDKEGAGTASTATGSNGADSARTDSAAGTGGAATATGDATGTDAGTGAAMAGNGPATTGAATFPTAGDAGMSTTASVSTCSGSTDNFRPSPMVHPTSMFLLVSPSSRSSLRCSNACKGPQGSTSCLAATLPLVWPQYSAVASFSPSF